MIERSPWSKARAVSFLNSPPSTEVNVSRTHGSTPRRVHCSWRATSHTAFALMKTTPVQRSLKKEQKNFRISAHGRRLIERLAVLDGLTESNLIEVLVRREAERRNVSLTLYPDDKPGI